jgi:hypothetical protein
MHKYILSAILFFCSMYSSQTIGYNYDHCGNRIQRELGISSTNRLSSTAAYALTGSNSCGTASAAITITVNTLPTIAANASNTVICSGGTVALYGSGASSYAWSNGVINNSPFSPAVTASYTVTGSDAMDVQAVLQKQLP